MPEPAKEFVDPFAGLINDDQPEEEPIEDDFVEDEFEEPIPLDDEEASEEEEQSASAASTASAAAKDNLNADILKGLQDLGQTLKDRLPIPQQDQLQEADVVMPMQYVDQIFLSDANSKALRADLSQESMAELNKVLNHAVRTGFEMGQQFAGSNIRRIHSLVPDAVAKVINDQNNLRAVADEFKEANSHLYTVGVNTPEEAVSRARAIQKIVNSVIRDHPERSGPEGFRQNLNEALTTIQSAFPGLTKENAKRKTVTGRGGAKRYPATFAGTTGKPRRGSTKQNVPDEAAQLDAFMERNSGGFLASKVR